MRIQLCLFQRYSSYKQIIFDASSFTSLSSPFPSIFQDKAFMKYEVESVNLSFFLQQLLGSKVSGLNLSKQSQKLIYGNFKYIDLLIYRQKQRQNEVKKKNIVELQQNFQRSKNSRHVRYSENSTYIYQVFQIFTSLPSLQADCDIMEVQLTERNFSMNYHSSILDLQQRNRKRSRSVRSVQIQDSLLTNGQENDFYRINRIIYQPSMHNNRQFIFTEPRLRSQYRSTFSHQRAFQKAKNKQNINVPQTFQLYGSDEVDRTQADFLQNEGVSYSTPNFSNLPGENQPEKAKFYKFQTIEKINQCNDNEQKTAEDNPKKTLLKKQSTTKCLYQKIHTQMINQIQNNEQVMERRQVERKSNKRKKCRIRSKEEYDQECQKFVVKKEKQQVEDLFRHVNREMKLSLKRKEGSNFYQKIRKNAIKKINYMSYNQKYYDNCEVQHLNSVIQNCNILIHKRDCKIDAKPLYQTLKHRQLTEYKDNFVAESSQSITKYSNTQKQLPSRRTSKNKASIIKTVIQEKQPPSVQSHKNSYFRYKGSQQSSRMKTQRLRQQTKILTNKMNKIVDSCSQQQHNMQQVKKGMKIFEFYCNKVDQGFNSRQNKLNNFLKWEQIDQ